MKLINKHLEGTLGLLLADELAKKSFTKEEYLSPFDAIKMEGMTVYLIYDDKDTFNGFIIIKEYKDIIYLFFIAVEEDLQGRGIGTEALKKLQDIYKDYAIIVDIELPSIDCSDYEKRLKRKSFYLQNGFYETKKALTYYNEYYEILSNKEVFNFDNYKELMESINTDKKDFNMEFIDLYFN